MNTAKLIGICHRIRITKPDKRGPLLRELEAAIDEVDEGAPGYLTGTERPQPVNGLSTVENLRAMLNDEGVRDNPRTLAGVVRMIRELT